MITQMTEPCILSGAIQIPTEKSVQYRNDFKDHRTLHLFWEHSSFNWKKKQFSIEMISKMTEPCILCGDIHIPAENSVQHWNDFKDQRTLHPLWGHSNPNRKTQFISKWLQRWKTLTLFVGVFKFQLTEPYIFVGTFKFQWKKQFSIQMISKMTEPYIVCGDFQIPTKKDSSVLKWSQRLQNFTSFEGRFRPQLKRQFSIEMITKMTETNILCGDISIPNWRRQFSIEIIPKIQIAIDRTLHLLLGHSNSNMKNSSASKWFQTWQNLTFDSLWRHSNSNWKMQFSIELISTIT